MKKFLIVLFILFAPVAVQALEPVSLKNLLQHYEGGGIHVGLYVYSLSQDREVFSYKENVLLNPASNVKVVTSATALKRLGPNFTFKTFFLSDAAPNAGRIRNLYVYGTGDPGLVQERLYPIAQKMAALGLREITGDIVIDQSYFDENTPLKAVGDPDRAYGAEITPFALNFNSFAVKVGPAPAGQKANVVIDPPSDYFRLKGFVTTGGRRGIAVSRKWDGKKEQVTVSGALRPGGEVEIRRSVSKPTLYAGYTLKRYLEDNGIRVLGAVREGKAAGKYVLLDGDSEPLSEILKQMNKFSNNFIAETLTKALGAKTGGRPGTTAKGIEAMKDYLAGLGLSPRDYFIDNGSGLSRKSRITPKALGSVLIDMARGPYRHVFTESLALAGYEGTVKGRLKNHGAGGRARVKTGTLNDTSSLSGFIPTQNGEMLVFALIASGPGAGSPRFHTLQEKITLQLAGY